MAWDKIVTRGHWQLGLFWRDPESFWISLDAFYEAGNLILGFAFWRFQAQLAYWK